MKIKSNNKIKIKEVNNILNDIGVMNIPQIIVNNKCDLIDSSKLDILKFKKNEEVFISAHDDNEFKDFNEDLLCQQQELVEFTTANPVGFIIFYVLAIIFIAGLFHLSQLNFKKKASYENKKNSEKINFLILLKFQDTF